MNERMTRKILSEARSSLEPTRADRNRIHKKVIAAVGAAGVVTAAAATAANAVGAGTGGIPPLISAIIKFAVGGLVIGTAAGLTVIVASAPDDDNLRVQTTVAAVAAPDAAPVTAPKVFANPLSDADDATTTEPVVPEQTSAKAATSDELAPPRQRLSGPRAVQPRPADDSSLLKEIALIRSASAAFGRGDLQQSLDLLNEYERSFPNGIMREERDGLHVSVLCNLGMKGEAQRAEQKFRRRYPSSPLTMRIGESCGALIGAHRE